MGWFGKDLSNIQAELNKLNSMVKGIKTARAQLEAANNVFLKSPRFTKDLRKLGIRKSEIMKSL